MSDTVTIDDVWKILRENAEQMKETDRRMQKTDRFIQETAQQMRETDRMSKEMKIEADRRIKELERLVKDVTRQVGNLSSRWGEFVEGVVAPACKTIFLQRGIPVHSVSRRVESRLNDGRTMEIDLLVTNTTAVILVEVKSKLEVADVKEHLNRLAEFKEFFPNYADKQVMGAVAGIVIEEGVDRFAMNQGLFVMVQSGESAELANGEEFVPRTW